MKKLFIKLFKKNKKINKKKVYYLRFGRDGKVFHSTTKELKENDFIIYDNTIFKIIAVGANGYICIINEGGIKEECELYLV